MKTKKIRDANFDVLKAYAIIFVVWGHFASGNKPLCEFIYSFHMPLFFMISGYFFHPKKDLPLNVVLSRNFKSLMLPYIFLCGAYVLYNICHCLLLSDYGWMKSSIIKYIDGDTGWYLTGLFFLRITFNYIPRKHIIPLLVIYLFLMPLINPTVLFNRYVQWVPRTLLNLPFFILGILIQGRNFKYSPLGGVISMVVLLGVIWKVDYSPLRFISDYKCLAFFILEGVLGILAFMNLTPLLTRFPFVTKIGESTIVIYTCHYFFLDAFKIINRLFEAPINQAIPTFLISIFVVTILCKLYYSILKKRPYVLGKSKA